MSGYYGELKALIPSDSTKKNGRESLASKHLNQVLECGKLDKISSIEKLCEK